jgi:hypothetical protein
VPSAIRDKELSHAAEQVLVLSMLLGNLMMIVMYIYENMIVWVLGLVNKVKYKNSMEMEMSM